MELKVASLRETLKKERKKVAFLAALLGVFMYVWIPLMKSSEPAAAPPAAAAAAPRPAAAEKKPTSAEPETTDCQLIHVYPAMLSIPLSARSLPLNPFKGFAVDEFEPDPEVIEVQEPEPSELALRKAEQGEAEQMTVSSIMLWGNNPSCVVDGVVLENGSQHHGFTVKAIKETHVLFSGRYGQYPVKVYSPLKLHAGIVDE